MGNYIKSHSNYVLQKKHQEVTDGVVYERDMTTIGGLNQYAKGQVPIYRSSNFIITVNNDIAPSRNLLMNGYDKNPNNDSTVWTLKDIDETDEITKESCELVIKQDYYSLRDFAYYGSCTELIRGSINNIITNFPGSLYVPTINGSGIPVYYEGYDKNTKVKTNLRLGGDNLFLVSNPFGINIHTELMRNEDITNPLKYMCNDGYKNYIDENGNEISWKVTVKYACFCNENGDCKVRAITNKDLEDRVKFSDVGVGGKIADISIGGKTVYAYKGNGGDIIYLTNSVNVLIAQPKPEFHIRFYNSLDSFEKLLVNPKSTPKYSALFEVISENSFGYETELKRFTFPTRDNGYNLCVNDGSFAAYVNSFLKYSELYDEVFSDNLWRSMTHESIKNFDWSYTREFSDGDEEEYVVGGTKIQKLIRLFGREFDELKSYIDAIKGYNQITYGDDNMLPDYYLTDVLEEEGWDSVNIFPFDDKFNQQFKLSDDEVIKPYDKERLCFPNGYFYSDLCDPSSKQDAYNNDKGIIDQFRVVENILLNRTACYSNEKDYTLDEINNEFMKRLIMNSRNIWRKKGTIEGIESLLALFGLKSDRMALRKYNVDCDDPIVEYDYVIKEYYCDISITEEPESDYIYYDVNDVKNGALMNIPDGDKCKSIDWYNSIKTVPYDTEDYRNGIYHMFQGLPVRAYIEYQGKFYTLDRLPLDDNGKVIDIDEYPIYLLPYYSEDMIIDGNPYYQMNGGWLFKGHAFNVDGEILENVHTETYRKVKTVNDIKELINLPMQSLRKNDIYYVNNIFSEYAIVDGMVMDIYQDEDGDKYIRTFIGSNSVRVGFKLFSDELTVSDKNGSLRKYVFKNYPINTEIRIYINDGAITAYGKYYAINTFQLFQEYRKEIDNMSHYFQLQNVELKNRIGGGGWTLLEMDSDTVKKLSCVVDYYKGNNPHSGNFNYDDGYEYIQYFETLFKHAIETLSFNERCIDNDYGLEYEIENCIKNIGFEFKGEPSENVMDGCSYNMVGSDNYNTLDEELVKKNYLHSFKNNIKYKLNPSLDNNASEREENELNANFVSDKIVNIKRMDINFINVNTDDKKKFYDYVILNYLSQVIPSTMIVHINYV